MGEDEGGAVELGDDLGHGEGLAGAGDAEQDLGGFSGVDAGGELADGVGLVALGGVFGVELEIHGLSVEAGRVGRKEGEKSVECRRGFAERGWGTDGCGCDRLYCYLLAK